MCIFICLIENINVLCDVLYMRMQLTDFFQINLLGRNKLKDII